MGMGTAQIWRRVVVLLAGTVTALGALAGPALAHGGGGSDASNFVSVVGEVVTTASAAEEAPQAAPVEGLTWRVLANDALLEARNDTGAELLVLGYQDEPYLRIGPEGVFENRNSPATYLNNDRFAETPVPETATPDAEPDWVAVSDSPVYAWHDHRIHWMAPTLPPQVKVDASQPVTVNNWTVPFTIDGQELSVSGTLRWEPPPPWWPWLLGAVVVLAVPVLPALRQREPDQRRRATLRSGAAVFAVVVVANVVHGVDDLIAVPATFTQNLVAGLQTFVPILIAAWATWRASKATPGSAQALVIGAAALVIGIAFTHVAVLSSSQIASLLPEWFTRAVIAADFAVIAPTVVVLLASGELRQSMVDEAQPVAEHA